MLIDTLVHSASLVPAETWGNWTVWFVRIHFTVSVLLIGAVFHGLFFKKPGKR